MRKVEAGTIGDAVRRMALDAAFEPGGDVRTALARALSSEESEVGRAVLREILENAELARRERRPLCQDTGVAVVWLELGSEVSIKGDVIEAVNSAVKDAWKEGGLRPSILEGALDRRNTGANTPATVHVELVPGERVKVGFMAKGGGSENVSRLAVLKPSDGRNGVVRFVLDAVRDGAPLACAPVIIGVGLGGTADGAAWLAKRALFRSLGEPNLREDLASLEREILKQTNATGIGPMGLGGRTTALACHVEEGPCHIASLPVAVCMNCHSHRVRVVEL